MAHPHLWLGTCTHCGHDCETTEDVLRNLRAQDVAKHFFTCANCQSDVPITRSNMQKVPFSSWTVLPPASGCNECGRDHDPTMPHDLTSLVYLYSFRSREAQAGREERWPTWHDAIAHCSPDIQQRWLDALADQGVEV